MGGVEKLGSGNEGWFLGFEVLNDAYGMGWLDYMVHVHAGKD